MSSKIQAIGVDLGGTKIAAALVDKNGRITRSVKISTDVDGGPSAVKKQIVGTVRKIIDTSGCSPVAVGVGVAGQIKPGDGAVRFAPNLDWHDVPLQEDLRAELDLPVVVTNDVRAITWGEWRFGAGKGCDDLICIFVGTGVGGGIVLDGKIVDGCSNTAGEVGHIVVDMHGPLCNCGSRGCLEVFAGGLAIGKRARLVARTHPEQGAALLRLAGGRYQDVSAETVSKAYQKGDPLALHLMQEAVEALVAGVTSLVHSFNPCLFILGGGVVDGLPEIVEQVSQGVRRQCLPAATGELRVVRAKLADEAGIVGAAALAMKSFAA
ncbi:MAG: ROK family protein [Desulforhopalus sp.]